MLILVLKAEKMMEHKSMSALMTERLMEEAESIYLAEPWVLFWYLIAAVYREDI